MGGVMNLTHFDLIQQFWDASFGLTKDNGETKRGEPDMLPRRNKLTRLRALNTVNSPNAASLPLYL